MQQIVRSGTRPRSPRPSVEAARNDGYWKPRPGGCCAQNISAERPQRLHTDAELGRLGYRRLGGRQVQAHLLGVKNLGRS